MIPKACPDLIRGGNRFFGWDHAHIRGLRRDVRKICSAPTPRSPSSPVPPTASAARSRWVPAAFGATVICADRTEGADETASLAKQSRGKAEAAHVDVADDSSVDEMWKMIAETYGRIDILVNNAGIATNSVRTHEYPIADWDRLMAINLRGVFSSTPARVSP